MDQRERMRRQRVHLLYVARPFLLLAGGTLIAVATVQWLAV